jgi:hypothetical protein
VTAASRSQAMAILPSLTTRTVLPAVITAAGPQARTLQYAKVYISLIYQEPR